MQNQPSCTLRNPCDFAHHDGQTSCQQGQGSCTNAKLLEADPSDFHDENLIAATKQIKQILEGIPPDPQGRTLSFLHTNMGSLLAWVRHGATDIPADAVTAKDDDATVAKALKLKGYWAAGAGQV